MYTYKCKLEINYFIYKVHVLLLLQDAGLKAISSGSTDKLADIFTDPMLACIKPLLLLLGWDRYPDVGSGQKLLDILWPEAQKAEVHVC